MVVAMGELYSDDSLDFGVDSSEDTEDASETDQVKTEDSANIETERCNAVHEKVHNLRDLLRQLQSGTLPGYLSKLAKIEQLYEERMHRCQVEKELDLQMIEAKFIAENQRLKEEYEAKKLNLKDNLLASLEEKKKQIEAEHSVVELTGAPLDSLDNRPSFTRKLRRRQNDPEKEENKQNKPPSPVISYSLTEQEIEEDLLQVLPPHKAEKIREKRAIQTSFSEDTERDRTVNDIKVEDGRLYYDKKWYGRYQNVFVECREFGKIPAVIQSICMSDIVVKKVTDLSKIKITIPQLQKGKFWLKRRC